MDYPISMVRGDTLAFGIELYDELGNLFTQDLDTAYLSCRKNYEAREYVFRKALNEGISKVATGQYVVRVAPEDTVNVIPGKYYYDLELGVNGDIFTFLKGVLDIEHDVTLH